jgi:hypothetical protein
MMPVSDFLLDQTVDLTRTVWTTASPADPDGGRMPSSQTVVRDVPAAVLPGSPRYLTTDDPATGLRRVTIVWPVSVLFGSDVGLHADDLVAWTDAADVGHTYQVKGYGPVAGQPGLWVATCEERQ